MSITISGTLEELRGGQWRLIGYLSWSNWLYVVCPIGGGSCWCGHGDSVHSWGGSEADKAPPWFGRGLPEDLCKDKGLEDYESSGAPWWTPEDGASSWLTSDELEQAIALALDWAAKWPEHGKCIDETVSEVNVELDCLRDTLRRMREIERGGNETRVVFGIWR